MKNKMASKEQYWTEEETSELVKMRKKEIPYKEIAKKLNRSVSSLQTQMHNIKMRVDRVSHSIYTEGKK